MPRYFFTTVDASGSAQSDVSFDFLDIEAAKDEAMALLSGMVKEALPGPPLDMLAVEIFDEDKKPLVELRLLLEVIPK